MRFCAISTQLCNVRTLCVKFALIISLQKRLFFLYLREIYFAELRKTLLHKLLIIRANSTQRSNFAQVGSKILAHSMWLGSVQKMHLVFKCSFSCSSIL